MKWTLDQKNNKPPFALIFEGRSVPFPKAFFSPVLFLSSIHPSWVVALIERQPKELHMLYRLACQGASELTAIARMFFQQRLYQAFFEEEKEVVPKELLPTHPLLSFPSAKLALLVAILGLQDLALDMRKTLDRKVQGAIINWLPKELKQPLRIFLPRGDLLPVHQEALSFWKKEIIVEQLEQKGLVRLSYALAGESPHLVWHIRHLLDVVLGTRLSKMLEQPLQNPRLKEQMMHQIESIMRLLT